MDIGKIVFYTIMHIFIEYTGIADNYKLKSRVKIMEIIIISMYFIQMSRKKNIAIRSFFLQKQGDAGIRH